jgi:regulatory protein
MLARREVSEAQVRQRLARRGFDPAVVDAAVARLKEERAIDDERVAETIARTQAALKRRGKLRVRQQIESAGISATTARRASDAVFDTLNPEELIAAALARRLRAGRTIADDREFARLYRYLLAQGFDGDQVMKLLAARRRPE